MKRAWHLSTKLLTGFFVTAVYAMPQATVYARPGVINYIEGQVYWNGQPISQQDLGPSVQLNANDTLSTTNGKVEVLLNPGNFLRLGDNTQIRMISPTLVNPQVELTQGEAIVEVIQVVKGNEIQIVDSSASVAVKNTGVYRITAQPQPAVAVYAGKAKAQLNGRSKEASKGHEIVLAANLPEQNFDTKAADELYAWSKGRSEYDAGASYAALNSLYAHNSSGRSYGNLYPVPDATGWSSNADWDSWAWLPATGYFSSPFGWGFYSPSYVGYAPVVFTTVGGHYGSVPINPKARLAGGGWPRTPKARTTATVATTAGAKSVAAYARAANASRGSFTASSSSRARSGSSFTGRAFAGGAGGSRSSGGYRAGSGGGSRGGQVSGGHVGGGHVGSGHVGSGHK
jgi:hypothetical protein